MAVKPACRRRVKRIFPGIVTKRHLLIIRRLLADKIRQHRIVYRTGLRKSINQFLRQQVIPRRVDSAGFIRKLANHTKRPGLQIHPVRRAAVHHADKRPVFRKYRIRQIEETPGCIRQSNLRATARTVNINIDFIHGRTSAVFLFGCRF